jgi:hypothetical protein
MQPEHVDLLLSYGLTGFVFAVTALAIVSLPWRSTELQASIGAWTYLTELSGGLARTGAASVRGAFERLVELGVRRPSPAMSRTLS